MQIYQQERRLPNQCKELILAKYEPLSCEVGMKRMKPAHFFDRSPMFFLFSFFKACYICICIYIYIYIMLKSPLSTSSRGFMSLLFCIRYHYYTLNFFRSQQDSYLENALSDAIFQCIDIGCRQQINSCPATICATYY